MIATSDAGKQGVTGSLSLSTGVSSAGNSGDIKIATGDAHRDPNPLWEKKATGSGGSMHLSVGTGNHGDGGHIKVLAGSTTASASIRYPDKPVNGTGGSVEIKSGGSQESSSGAIIITTSDAGISGVSGQLTLTTGKATSGDAGHIGEQGLTCPDLALFVTSPR